LIRLKEAPPRTAIAGEASDGHPGMARRARRAASPRVRSSSGGRSPTVSPNNLADRGVSKDMRLSRRTT
jgi:hypothetical protein